MKYRREIDGLRALAVVPVILFHAGFGVFSGGFIGVDIFFVISGYLITTIIYSEISTGSFSLINFYERRARRILPCLYLVMLISTAFSFLWMMPDELKNYGQSLVATTLFSNNILLALTSGYWELASEYKPLLHTWSLGVEEQYYVLFPLILLALWKYFKKHLGIVVLAIAIASLAYAEAIGSKSPDFAFYLLPSRAWELLIGSIIALFLSKKEPHSIIARLTPKMQNQMANLGLLMILGSIFFFSENQSTPGAFTLIPTIGASLIIINASDSNLAGRILGSKLFVGIGLISYSAYLWHQPLFSFSRVYSKNVPGLEVAAVLTVATFALAYFSWRFIENPIRNKKLVSRKSIFIGSAFFSLLIIAIGILLHKTYGMASRVFPENISIQEMDKKIYNERVFQRKKNEFTQNDKKRILVVGNSVARDFVNMTTETFDVSDVEIIYRNDFSQCIRPYKNDLQKSLYENADVIVFASGFREECVKSDIEYANSRNSKILFIGPKHFGSNLNWIIRLPLDERRSQFNVIPDDTLRLEKEMTRSVPPEYFISLLSNTRIENKIPITNEDGILLSTDRVHLTKYGAIYFGSKALLNSRYESILKSSSARE